MHSPNPNLWYICMLLSRLFASMMFMHKCHCYSYLMLDRSIHSNKSHPYFSKAFVLICDLSTALFNMRELQMRRVHSSFLLAPLLTLNHPSTYSCYLSSTSLLLLWNGLNIRKAAGSAAASQFKWSTVWSWAWFQKQHFFPLILG